MPIFSTNTASINLLQVTGSSILSGSSNVLTVLGSGSTIFTISGSNGAIFSINDDSTSSTLFNVSSASISILNIDTSKNVSISGSLIVTGSIIGTASFATTASFALNGGGGAAFPYTGSAQITGSLGVTGSISTTGNINSGNTIVATDSITSNNNGFVSNGNGQSTLVGRELQIPSDIFGVTAPLGTTWIGSIDVTGNLAVVGNVNITSGSGFVGLTAGENLAAGDFVNIYSGGVRKASNNDTTKQAHGFVINTVTTGANITVYYSGVNRVITGLTAGARYFLGVAGAEVTTPPTAAGQLSQEIGVAISTTAISVNFGPAIVT